MKRRQLVGMSLGGSIVLSALGSLGCGRMGFDDSIQEQEPPPMKLLYPTPGTFHALLNETELRLVPKAVQVDSFSVSPPLPLGLALDESTGVLSGKAAEASDRKRYVITGKGAQGELSVAIHLTTLAGWKVTTPADGPDDNLTDGICMSMMANGCSLRAAIQNANLAGSQRMVLLQQGEHLVTSAITPINNDLVIAGAGVGETVIKGGGAGQQHRLTNYGDGRAVRLEGVSIREFTAIDGGVMQINDARLEVFDVEFSRNVSDTGGVMCVDGGGEAYLENVSFLNNEAPLGASRGGVFNVSNSDTKVTVVKSTAIGNQGKQGSFAWVDTGGTLEVINSTFTGNRDSESGVLATQEGTIAVRSSTIFANVTTGEFTAGLGIGNGSSRITLANSIIAFNLSEDGLARNCESFEENPMLISLGGNLFNNDGDGCKEALAGRPEELNAEIKLESEAKSNGGRTKTVALLPGSAAIGHGLAEHCPEEDQRGVKRALSENGRCDAGAYELEE